jgi:5-methylcytosine-specific restriction endonuclease McrA
VTRYAPRCARCTRPHSPELPCWHGRYSRRITADVFATQGRICWLAYPGCLGLATQADHIVPRSEWGGDDPGNLRPACARCNASRGRAEPFEVEAPPRPRPGAAPVSSAWGRP